MSEGLDERRAALTLALVRAEKKISRRADAIREDLERAREAATLRMQADLLLAYQHSIPRGARAATVRDANDQELVLALPERQSPVAHAQTLYRKARKLDTAARVAAERLAATERERVALRALAERVALVTDEEGLAAAITGAARLRVQGAGAATKERARSPRKPTPRVPYRRFLAHGEREVRVGKSARDNDDLTLHHSKPRDLFLHARDVPGAHVIVPLRNDETCPTELFLDAATLAAHFSDARGEGVIDVVHVSRRHVRKPRGSPPGLVAVAREKVTPLRVEATRLTRLLAAEVLD